MIPIDLFSLFTSTFTHIQLLIYRIFCCLPFVPINQPNDESFFRKTIHNKMIFDPKKWTMKKICFILRFIFHSIIIAKKSSDPEADQITLIFSIFPFISTATSTGTEPGMDNKLGGRCLSHNMKLLFKVAQPNAPAESADPNNTGKRLHTTNSLSMN